MREMTDDGIVTAGMVVIGDEILSGRTRDRNIGHLAEIMTAIGIDLKVNVVEFSTWLQDVYTNHTFDISLVDHNESHDFASWTDPTYYFGYDNKNVTKLYNEGVAATSDKERDAKFAAAAKLVSEDAPADWLFNYRITTATAKGVEGFPFDLNQTVLPLYNVTYTK